MASAMRWRKGVITILLGSGGNSPPPRLHLNAHARKHHAKKTAMAASEDQPSRSGLVQRCEVGAHLCDVDLPLARQRKAGARLGARSGSHAQRKRLAIKKRATSDFQPSAIARFHQY